MTVKGAKNEKKKKNCKRRERKSTNNWTQQFSTIRKNHFWFAFLLNAQIITVFSYYDHLIALNDKFSKEFYTIFRFCTYWKLFFKINVRNELLQCFVFHSFCLPRSFFLSLSHSLSLSLFSKSLFWFFVFGRRKTQLILKGHNEKHSFRPLSSQKCFKWMILWIYALLNLAIDPAGIWINHE